MKLQINFLIIISFIWTSSVEMFALPGKFEFKLTNVICLLFISLLLLFVFYN